MNGLEQKCNDAIWVAKALFDRNKVAGSAANLSFRHDNLIYITGSGTCFGRLNPESFAVINLDGTLVSGVKPSKEAPLHLMLYQKTDAIQAVIHTHCFYTTLWSCLDHPNPDDVIPAITPYLKMKVGTIALVPYAKPGSAELFAHMQSRIQAGDGYILQNHGPVIGGDTVLDAFYGIEELEESAKMAWLLRNEPGFDKRATHVSE